MGDGCAGPTVGPSLVCMSVVTPSLRRLTVVATCAALCLGPAVCPSSAAIPPDSAFAGRPEAAPRERRAPVAPSIASAWTPAGAGDPGAALLQGVAPRTDYTWPTGGPATVLEDFDPPAVVWGSGHRGVDLALAAGSSVLAAGDGTVAFAGMVAGRPVVSIDHADGIRTTYEPVEPSVSAGERVAAGQVIGVLLPGHRADGVDALHWGARTGPKSYVNPLRLLTPAVIRLKPLDGS